MNDKHKIKVGELANPLAAAECGRQVLVHSGATFEVSDHDFSKFSITPSVNLFCTVVMPCFLTLHVWIMVT